MATAGPGTGFSLSYELQPRDIAEMQAASTARRRSRARIISGMVPWALLGAAFTAITVTLDQPSLVKDSSGAPGWMYAVDAVSWSLFIFWASAAWRLSPKRLGRLIWRAAPLLHGRHHDVVDERGVTSTAPNGTCTFVPWASLVRVRETEHAFHLLDDSGEVGSSLPKRGLDGPDLIPVLRCVLDRSVGGAHSATSPAGSSKP